jgi:hypothetical protein
MKKQAYMIATMILLLTVGGLSTARAQTNSCTPLIASIPFEFSVGNKTMPAGEYTVSCINPASDLKTLQLRTRDGHEGVMLRTNSVIRKAPGDAKLIFNRYGDQYFFAQAWFQAESTGMQAVKSAGEKRIARELAANKSTREVAALRPRR